MELTEVVSKLFELHQLNSHKSTLVLEIAERYALDRNWDIGGDLGRHNRDEHRRYWNSEYWLKCKHEHDEEMRELRDRYQETCLAIEKLEAELKAHFDSSGLVA